MGNPITWQNVNSSESRLVGQLMDGAQRGITGGFDKLSEVIAQREGVNQGVADRARGAAEQDALNQLYGYKTPEELQAARMSGVLDQRLAALDPRNQAAFRTAMFNQPGKLQEQVTATNTFDNQVRVNQDAPILDQAAKLAATGDKAGLQALVAGNPAVRGLADYVQKAQAGALAAVANPNAIAAERFKATLRSTAEAKATAEAVSGLNAANLANRLAPITNANTEATAVEQAASLKETAKGREVDAAVNKAVAAYRQSGGSNDTEAKAGILRDLASQGHSASQIARIAPGLDLSLNTGPIAPIGKELSDFNSQIAKRETVQAQLENQYGVKTEPGSVGPLLKDGLAVIDGVLPKDSARSEIYKERLGAFLSKGGIRNTLKDAEGKPVLGADGKPIVNRVLPTAAQLQVIVSSIDKKWHNTRFGWLGLSDSGMKDEIDNALQAWADSPEAQKGAAELTKLELTKQLQTIRKAEAPPPQLPAALGGKR